MDYLAKGDAPFSDELWGRIDEAVVETARQNLVARRFLPLEGPLGPGATYTKIDLTGKKQEVLKDGFGAFEGCSLVQVPQLYEDFWLYGRDLAAGETFGASADVSAARTAAAALAFREDEMVFYGVKQYGIDGILTARGVNTQKRGDWGTGEGAFADVAAAVATLTDKRRIGRHTLVLSQDLFVQLQHITAGTGMLEVDRVAKLVDGRVFHTATLQPKTAVLLSSQAHYVDLLVGQDIAVAYTEAVDLNHHLRVLETALPRVKAPDAIVVFK